MPDIINNQITELGIDQLQPNPLQPRGKMEAEELQDLVVSIQQHGVLEPIVVAHTPAGYQIIAGERRWRASKIAGLVKVPVLIKETNPKGMLEMAIIENVQRVNLNPLDRAKAFRRLMDEFNLEPSVVAERIGKSTSYVSNTIRLLTLPDAIKDGLLSREITEGHARALASIEDTRHMIDVYKQVLKETASVRRTEELSRRKKADTGVPSLRTNERTQPVYAPELRALEEKLTSALGENSKVNITRSRTQTRIMLVLKGAPEETDKLMRRIISSASNQ